ncbi:hypothetical protein [Allohahella marinimesophila]|uniref:Flavin-binding monooxygenase-like protein n=1 Tax=Allohahella marinimesophila TaxID=1054972 RepID=A0ABP7NZB2_9GAMM
MGMDLHFWLRFSGVDRAPLGAWFGWKFSEAVLDQGQYQAAIRDGRIGWRPMFDRLSEDGMHWGEAREAVDALVLATGYRQAPAFLASLERDGRSAVASQRGGISRSFPGLYFVGVPWQRSHASATLRGVGADAAHVVSRIRRHLS